MKRTPEGKVKDIITATLKHYGLWYFFPANNGFGKSGIPDIIVICNGKFIGIEVKANESKQPTVLQQLIGDEIKTAGGYWFLIRSKDELVPLVALIESLR
jgi:hypothetical protein